MEIDYLTESPAKQYAIDTARAETLGTLRAVLTGYSNVAPDAVLVAEKMTEADFERWRVGVAKERSGKFAGEAFAKEFVDLLMPEKMVIASLLELKYHVPWGTAFLRSEEEGWPQLKDKQPAA